MKLCLFLFRAFRYEQLSPAMRIYLKRMFFTVQRCLFSVYYSAIGKGTSYFFNEKKAQTESSFHRKFTHKVVPAVNITASEAVLLINRRNHFVLKRCLIGPKDAILIFSSVFRVFMPNFFLSVPKSLQFFLFIMCDLNCTQYTKQFLFLTTDMRSPKIVWIRVGYCGEIDWSQSSIFPTPRYPLN